MVGAKKYFIELDIYNIFFSLSKSEHQRPKYKQLLQDPFIMRAQKEEVDVAAYVTEIMDEMANNGISAFTTNQQ